MVFTPARQTYCVTCGDFVDRSKTHIPPTNVDHDSGSWTSPHKRPGFSPWSHDCGTLLLTIKSYISRPYEVLDFHQLAAYHEYRPWTNYGWTGLRPTSKLQHYFELFDDLIFAGSLKLYVTIFLVDDIDGPETLGNTVFSLDHTMDNPSLTIRIVERAHFLPASLCGTAVLQTLLHEMIHAFFMLYHCHCSKCVIRGVANIGITGHGLCFRSLAKAIECFV